MNRADGGFDSFNQLSATDKIALIKQRIISACEELATKAPDSMWIVTWREYGITDGADSRSVSSRVKISFKEEMIALTKHYPQLAILAGTISTAKQTKLIQLKTILEYYQAHRWIEELEKSSSQKTKIDELKKTEQQIALHRKQIEDLLTIESSESKTNVVTVIRNTCYLFIGDKILRHDKSAPIDETGILANTVFQPAKGKNASPIFDIQHTVTGQPLRLGVEICRESDFGVLRKWLLEKEDSANTPLIHFIISDGINWLDWSNVCGTYCFRIDSLIKPRAILPTFVPEDKREVILYQNNLCQKIESLTGPLQALYPFEKRVLDHVNLAISWHSNDHLKRKILEFYRDAFAEAAKSVTVNNMYQSLQDFRNQTEIYLTQKKTITLFNMFYSFFKFTSLADMAQWFSDLEKMLDEESEKFMNWKDYASREDAPLDQKTALLYYPIPRDPHK